MVRDIIKELREKGTTIFLNSHFLSEVEVTCDRVAFIKDGVIVRTARMDALVDGELTLKIRARNLTPEVVAGLAQWGRNIRQDDGRLTMAMDGEAELPLVNRYLVDCGVDVYAFSPQQVSLEDLFLQVVEEDNES
jgi:ABC-2 type transport system ATP-binding protein